MGNNNFHGLFICNKGRKKKGFAGASIFLLNGCNRYVHRCFLWNTKLAREVKKPSKLGFFVEITTEVMASGVPEKQASIGT